MILYYSNKCSKCAELFETQNTSGIKKMICVDKESFPQYIKSVPSLVVNNKDLYTGTKAITYLQENSSIEPYEFGFNRSGAFSFIDDDSCRICEQKNYSEIN